MERLERELQAVGFFLSGHPLDAYETALGKLGVLSYADFEARCERGAASGRLAGIVISARERRSQKGNRFAFVVFSEPTGQFEAVLFSDTLAQARELLEPGTAVLASVEGEREGENLKLRVQAIEPLDRAAAGVQRGLKLILDTDRIAAQAARFEVLQRVFKPGGSGEIRLVLPLAADGREVEFALPGRYDVSPSQRAVLATVPGVIEVVDL
jgi:DNA polymerase-3 subunit alpha